MSVTVTEATKQRLARSKAVFGPEHDLSILDKLTVPKTFDDLVMQIHAADCNMFHPMVGMPRAYMEIPIWDGTYRSDGMGYEEPHIQVERWVYQVFHWWMPGTRSKCEAPICEQAWKDFVALRKEYAKLYGDASPVMIIRRQPEFEQERRPTRTRMNMRFCIPGLRIEKYKHFVDGVYDLCSDKYRVVPEAFV